MRTIVLTCICIMMAAVSVQGKIYKWTDRSGRVHFTDNIGVVPPEYLERAQERNSLSPSRPSTYEIPYSQSTSSSNPPPTARHYLVPLFRIGNAMLVDVVLDGFLTSRLLVDTGATLTVISTATARQLGLNLTDAAVIPLQSVSGQFFAPLTKVRSMTVGDATVRDVEVVVHDIASGGGTGLLGMSFMDNFQVTVNAAEETMILTELSNASGGRLYGGHPKDWWRRKFRYYRRQIEAIEAYLQRQATNQYDKTLRYFRTELIALDRKATQAAVPRHWRY
ncbi:MAG: aspartyl protease family protein [bacterium]|nr:aspartyl protease family protein [bacterium]